MPASPILITRARLESAYSVLDVAQCADQDADVTAALQEASDIGWGLLRAGFPAAAIVTLAAGDTSVSGYIASIAMDLLARRRKEFRLQDGRTVYSNDRKIAESSLIRVADGYPRTVAEVVGPQSASALLGNRERTTKTNVMSGGGF